MKFIKLLTGAGFILSLASLGGNWYLYEQYQAEKLNGQKLETNLVQLSEQSSSLKRQVAEAENLKIENERLRGQLKDYVRQRDDLKKEMDGVNDKALELQKQIRKLEDEKKELKKELDLAKAAENAVVQETNRLPAVPNATLPSPSAVPVVADEPREVKPAAVEKTEKIVQPPMKLEVPKKEEVKKEPFKLFGRKKEEKPQEVKPVAKEAPPAAAPAKPAEDARPQQVLTVNRQFNFVVVNMGLRNKVKIGDVLRVEQQGKLIGRIQVEKLYENFSACAIMEEIKPAQIHEGDLVRLA